MKKWIATLFFGALLFNVNGQLLLKSGKVTPTQVLYDQVKASEADIVDGRFYGIITKGTNTHNLQIGKNTGFGSAEFLEYIPKNSFIVSFPKDFKFSNQDKSALSQFGYYNGVAFTAITPQMKLSRNLSAQNIPDWAWVADQKIEVWVTYFKDLKHSSIAQKLRISGFEITQELPNEDLIALAIDPEKIMDLAQLPYVFHLQEKEDPGQKENSTARTNHRVNTVQSNLNGGLQYDGSGVIVGVGDDGLIGPHIDYQGRLTQSAGASTGDHGDHVAGTVFGAGNLDPLGRGMAPGADVYYEDYPDNINNADANYINQNVRITSSSYSNGCNAGYTNFTRRMDQDVIDNPNMIHIFSAGNNGGSNCQYGAGAGWGNVTGGHKIAKNAVAVANLTRIDGLANSSSRGPASDGRIKPDVGAVGSQVYSTTNPNLYTLKSGTSMACPGVSGATSILYQAYKDKNGGQEPTSGLMKAILMNSCDDLGNAGPDFRFGYGRINIRKGYEIIEQAQHMNGSIATSSSTGAHTISVPANTSKVKVMLLWSDPPASTAAARALVNDLDLSVTHQSTTYQPWVLDPTPNSTALNSAAVRARDSLNNIEQVTIDNPAAGNLSIDISAFNLPQGPQSYYIVYEFIKDEIMVTYPIGGEGFVQGETEFIRWDASAGTTNFTVEYSTDNGNSWNVLSSSVPADRRYYQWNISSNIIATGQALVRVSRGTQTDQGEANFSIIETPSNIQFLSSCPDSLSITWNAVSNAQGYVIYRLGTKYMDSIGYTTSTFYTVNPNNPTVEDWFSIAAVTNDNTIGRRAVAVEKPLGVFNCQLNDDVGIAQLLSPPEGPFPNCFPTNGAPVSINLVNSGNNDVFSFNVHYKLGTGTTITELITDTILSGNSLQHTFTTALPNLVIGTRYNLLVWASFAQDNNPYNDSVAIEFEVFQSTSVSFPYSNNFELFPLCSTNNDCEQTTCGLTSGWVNPTNGLDDNIDWRTDDGGTASNGTGPTIDHNPGTSNGNYLYTEASGGCTFQEAILISPCISLASTTAPILEFWHHMRGVDMGDLSVDIYDGDQYHLNVIPTISGDQGSNWLKATVDLKPYKGKTIFVRFRGVTGGDFASDMALDDFNIIENSVAPSAGFNQNTMLTCVNGVVDFTDNTTNFPNAWAWHITPNTFQFVNGTNANSQNVSVRFTAAGTYDVSLVASNPNGSDSIFMSQAVNADPGIAPPLFEDFEASFPPTNWDVLDADNVSQWTNATVIGPYGFSTRTAHFDNFNSPAVGEEDGLLTLNLDLRNIASPALMFDRAYALRTSGGNSDTLRIDVTNDCGETYSATTYLKSGNDLATAPATSSLFSPTLASDWDRDTLDLTPYVGQNIRIRFTNISQSNNGLYLDNIQIVDGTVAAPVAAFNVSDTILCLSDSLVLTSQVGGGNPTSYQWSAQSGNPFSFTGAGPHAIRFTSMGPKMVTLTVSNDGGFSSAQANVTVLNTPVSNFLFSINNITANNADVQFTDNSINGPTSWSWDFDDGNTSNVQSPSHSYTQNGTYDVQLTVTNSCGTTNRTRTILVQGINVEEYTGLEFVNLFPNPGNGNFQLAYGSLINGNGKLVVTDLSGKTVYAKDIELNIGDNQINLDLSSMANGIYMVSLETEIGAKTIRAIKQ